MRRQVKCVGKCVPARTLCQTDDDGEDAHDGDDNKGYEAEDGEFKCDGDGGDDWRGYIYFVDDGYGSAVAIRTLALGEGGNNYADDDAGVADSNRTVFKARRACKIYSIVISAFTRDRHCAYMLRQHIINKLQ